MEYIDNWNLFEDLKIILLTIQGCSVEGECDLMLQVSDFELTIVGV
jgi:hypothetical protein